MLVRAIQPLGRSIHDCGEAMCVPLLSAEEPVPGAGVVLVNKDGGGPVATTALHTPAARDALWAHTHEVFRRLGVAPIAAAAGGPVEGGATSGAAATGPDVR